MPSVNWKDSNVAFISAEVGINDEVSPEAEISASAALKRAKPEVERNFTAGAA